MSREASPTPCSRQTYEVGWTLDRLFYLDQFLLPLHSPRFAHPSINQGSTVESGFIRLVHLSIHAYRVSCLFENGNFLLDTCNQTRSPTCRPSNIACSIRRGATQSPIRKRCGTRSLNALYSSCDGRSYVPNTTTSAGNSRSPSAKRSTTMTFPGSMRMTVA